ncbi:MAG TPA: hypothetical protein VGN75_15120 [Kaistia sp.]|jgi:hypothetical protein|nr:hypothetical protein [Kaistia sp.]
MKRPSFQFYAADWRANAKLRRCSPAARGVWVDIMCLLHDADEYGLVRWPLKEIAQAVGASLSHVRELVDKDVLKGSDKQIAEPFVYTPRSGRRNGEPVTLIAAQAGPLWYSSRMVKDEYVRSNVGASTRFKSKDPEPSDTSSITSPGGEAAPNPSPSPSPTRRGGEAQSDGSSSSSSSSSSTEPYGSESRGGEATGSKYAFEGRVIRLTEADFTGWKSAYSAIPDLRAELKGLDDWLTEQDDGKRKRWFQVVSGSLSRKHQEWLKKRQERLSSGPGTVGTPAVGDRVDWRWRVSKFREKGFWQDQWGPKPLSPGCFAPADLVAEIMGVEVAN